MEIVELGDAPNHGGKRPGAGRPKKSGDGAAELYRVSRARREVADADMATLKFKVESKKYVLRTAATDVAAVAMAMIADVLRPVPERLERQGVGAEFCRLVEFEQEAALSQATIMFEMLFGTARADAVAARNGGDDQPIHEATSEEPADVDDWA